jgi:hypothetical protein
MEDISSFEEVDKSERWCEEEHVYMTAKKDYFSQMDSSLSLDKEQLR